MANHRDPRSENRDAFGSVQGRPWGIRASVSSPSTTKLNDAAAVALGRPVLGQRRELLHGLALFSQFEAGFTAGVCFAIVGLRNGGGAAQLTEFQNFNLEQATLIFNLQHVADVDLACGLGAQSVGEDAADVAGLAGESARLEEAGCPEPLVHAQLVHGTMLRGDG